MFVVKVIAISGLLVLGMWVAVLACANLLPPAQYPKFYHEEFDGHRYVVYGYIYDPSSKRPFVHDPNCPCHK